MKIQLLSCRSMLGNVICSCLPDIYSSPIPTLPLPISSSSSFLTTTPMARFLSQTLIRHSHLPSTPSHLISLRPRSSISDNSAHIVEIDLGEVDAAGGNGTEVDLIGGMRKLEDAIHGIVVRRSAPAWLPFRPGSSYWVPPRKKGYSHGLVELVGKLTNPISNEEMMALTTTRGWPSSSYFIGGGGEDKGLPMHQIEENQETYTVKSDEDA